MPKIDSTNLSIPNDVFKINNQWIKFFSEKIDFFTRTTINFLPCWIFKFYSSHRNYILSFTNYWKKFENQITKSIVIKILRVNVISVPGVCWASTKYNFMLLVSIWKTTRIICFAYNFKIYCEFLKFNET